MISTFAHLIWVASALPSDPSVLRNEISALANAATVLDNRSEFWEMAMPWFTAIVVIGLLGDLVVIVWDRKEEVHARLCWVRLGFNPAELSSRWKFALELFSTAAIFLGVALELSAGVEIAVINAQLRTINGELRNKSVQLVALLEKETEDERMARVQLEQSMAWRHLTAVQKHALCSLLPADGVNNLMVRSFPEAPEAWSYSNEFAEEIRDCQIGRGFGPNGHLGRIYVSSNVTFGLWVQYSDTPHPDFPVSRRREKAYWLAAKLKDMGIDVAGVAANPSAGIVFPDLYVGPVSPPHAEQTTNIPASATAKRP